MTSSSSAVNSDKVLGSTGPFKWVKSIRALPSDPNNNDFLKTDYIEVNLNNSRKLIANLNNLTESSDAGVKQLNEVNESLIRLHNIRNELSWLNNI